MSGARRSVLAATLAASLVAVCGASGAPGRAASKPVTVTLGEFFFRPRVVTVHVGQRVRFVNVGKIAHTVADTDADWNVRSKLIRPHELDHGDVQVVRMPHAGTVRYLCTFHPTLMRGKIVVVG